MKITTDPFNEKSDKKFKNEIFFIPESIDEAEWLSITATRFVGKKVRISYDYVNEIFIIGLLKDETI